MIACFRYVPGGQAAYFLNDLRNVIMEVVETGVEVFGTQAVLNSRFALRANVLHHATIETDPHVLNDLIQRTAERLAAGVAPGGGG